MHFTNQLLTVLAASLLAATAAAAPKCHVGTAWPDSRDCHKFFECAAGGIPVRKSCGPGTAYSPRLKICDYEENVPSCHRGKPDWKPHWSTDDKGKDKGKGKGKGKDEWPKNKYEQEKRQDLHSGWEHDDEHKHRHPYPHRPWWNEHSGDHRPHREWPGYGDYNGEETTDETNEETTEETTAESTGETTGETNEDTTEDTSEDTTEDTIEETNEDTN